MHSHADKTQENKNQSVSAVDSQRQSGGESTFQFVDNRPEAVAQRKVQEMANNSPQVSQLKAFQEMADTHSARQHQPVQKKENKTGLPDNLKSGIENLSGYSMDDVKVHYNSDKPAQLQAHAYAQGTNIHLGQGQEKHLPHEAWHVVQQKQGRVKPTLQMKGVVAINDDTTLELEADLMGGRALQMQPKENVSPESQTQITIQRANKGIENASIDSGKTIQRHVIHNGKVIDETKAVQLLGPLDDRQYRLLKTLINSENTYSFEDLNRRLGIDSRVWKTTGSTRPDRGEVTGKVGEVEKTQHSTLSNDLVSGVEALVSLDKVGKDNDVLKRIEEANQVHKKVFELLKPILPDVKTYMQGSGGQVQNALSLIGAEEKKNGRTQTLENMVSNFCAVYDPSNLDFSDVDLLIPVQSTKSFGTKILMDIRNKLRDQGAEIKSAAVMGGTSSFSHIFLNMKGQDIDIVIQDQRFAELYAPRLPHMAARADLTGQPGFIRTQNEDRTEMERRPSMEGFTDLVGPSRAKDLVTEHMGGGLQSDKDLEGRKFNFEQIRQQEEDQVRQFREALMASDNGEKLGELLGENIKRLTKGWTKKKERKSAEVQEQLEKLQSGAEVDMQHKRGIDEQTEFRKNQKQFYKPAKLEGEGESTLADKKSVVAFYHMLAQHLNPGELSATGVADFTASLLAKKGYTKKTDREKADWLKGEISKLQNVQTYFGALKQMDWAPDESRATVENARNYFLRQTAIYRELAARTEWMATQKWPDKASDHLKERAFERQIEGGEIMETLKTGVRYVETNEDRKGTVYYNPRTGVSVCLVPSGELSTCYRSDKPKDGWKRSE